MKKLLIAAAALVFVLILIIALPQLGGSCVFYGTLSKTQSCTFALMQTAGLGGVLGGVLVMIWKVTKDKQAEKEKEEEEDNDDEDDDSES